MNPLSEIAERLIEHYGERLVAVPVVAQNAVTANFDTNLSVEVHAAAGDEYSIRWRIADDFFGIDTAPLHRELATYPNHLHSPDGTVRADPFTRPGAPLWDNLRAVLEVVLHDPRLERVP